MGNIRRFWTSDVDKDKEYGITWVKVTAVNQLLNTVDVWQLAVAFI